MPRSCRWVGAVVVVAAATAHAQTSPPSPTADDERGNLLLASGTAMRLTLGGYAQVDGRWVSGPATRAPDGLLLRRARLVFDANHPDGWHVRLQPDFGQGRVQVQDAYVGYERRGLVTRIGRFRPAFGTERMQSSATLLAPERGIANSLMPSRSFGAQVLLARRDWRVALGGFRTPVGSDAQPVDTDGDVNAVAGTGHDVLLRVAHVRQGARVYTEVQASVLLGSERGTVEAPALARVLSVAQQPLLAFVNDGTSGRTAIASGARWRASGGVLAGTRRTVVAGEMAWVRQTVTLADNRREPQVAAGAVRVAHVWNGTRAASQEIVPVSPTGAFEAGLRLGALGSWGEALSSVLARGAVTHARTAGVALSWLPTRHTRLSLGYDVTKRQAPNRPLEHALVTRWQQGF